MTAQLTYDAALVYRCTGCKFQRLRQGARTTRAVDNARRKADTDTLVGDTMLNLNSKEK
jgi:hypothetical protein